MALHEWEYHRKKVRADPESGILLREEHYAETSPCAWCEPSPEEFPYGTVFALEACNAEILRLAERVRGLDALLALKEGDAEAWQALERRFAKGETGVALTPLGVQGFTLTVAVWLRDVFLDRAALKQSE